MRKMFKKLKSTQRGQSLVEMALIAPILIFFLLGVFEVGWALRGYLVLINVNREITRFAIRPGYLDFSTQASVITSYQTVQNWVDTAVANQLDLDFDPATGNATLIISHIVVDTGLPCINADPAACTCNNLPENNLFPLDDLIVFPGRPGMEYQLSRFGPFVTETGTRTTRINYEDLISNTLIPENNRRNCELLQKGGMPSADNMIITELFFDQPQLFGFPLISSPFTDPVPLYTRTTMRLVGATRSTGTAGGSITANIDTIGPVCAVYPFALKQSNVPAGAGTPVDILDGNGNPHFGWLAWNPGETDEDDLANELYYPTSSLNNFVNPVDSNDDILSVGDWVTSIQGDHDALLVSGPNNDPFDGIMGRQIIIPIWDSYNSGVYRISGFARVQFPTSADDIDLNAGTVTATYLELVTEGCP